MYKLKNTHYVNTISLKGKLYVAALLLLIYQLLPTNYQPLPLSLPIIINHYFYQTKNHCFLYLIARPVV